MATTILMMLLRINWPNFTQKQYTESSDTESYYQVTSMNEEKYLQYMLHNVT